MKRWRPYPQFKGRTGALSAMSCHISVLSPGHHPHPPHVHPEEELLLVIDGAVEIELADAPDGDGSRRHRLRPGMFSYYPATQHHTIHNVGDRPATYLMFKWRGGIVDVAAPLPTGIFACDFARPAGEPVKPVRQRLLFEQATHTLGKLHAHLTTLQPGAGYAAHADPYDVAILLFSGKVETVGERVRPFGLIYYSAGEPHGMRNVGATPADYLVFEFHGPSAGAPAATPANAAAREAKPRRRPEKRRRKRGLRGFLRKLVKAARRLGR